MDATAIQKLKAISLLDGRNRDKVNAVSDYFSEYALIKYRVFVELSYLIFLLQNTGIFRKLTPKEISCIKEIYENFDESDALKIKDKEKIINHDVKAMEYFLKEELSKSGLSNTGEFVHFALTSYDINIPSYALMIHDFRKKVLLPKLDEILVKLATLITATKNFPMLARTHGQPALPTTMGKELAVFYKRIKDELKILKQLPIEAKLTGAVGNFSAHTFAAPETDWMDFSKKFIKSLGLTPNVVTTQIMPYESWLRIFDSVKRINNIFTGFAQDIWWYISFEYFLQKNKKEEVGSSTMAHKINPITFENAEGNLGLSNSLFEYFVKKLSVSRLQRDLSDSTVKRDFGLAFGFTLLAYDSLLSGLSRITPDKEKMEADLEKHWEIFSEGIQTFLKLKGYKNAYEILKDKTRGEVITREKIYKIIDDLPIKSSEKKLLKIPALKTYMGRAVDITECVLKEE